MAGIFSRPREWARKNNREREGEGEEGRELSYVARRTPPIKLRCTVCRLIARDISRFAVPPTFIEPCVPAFPLLSTLTYVRDSPRFIEFRIPPREDLREGRGIEGTRLDPSLWTMD